jgi:hypothetical protein
MIDVTAFTFVDTTYESVGAAKIVDVPSSVTTKNELIASLAESLAVPDYFGANWDALDECLRDLSWIKERIVVLRHDAVPHLPGDVARVYLDVLSRSVRSWGGTEEHEVVVTFPSTAREQIVALANGPMSDTERGRPN